MVGGRRYMVRIGVDVRTCGHELLDNEMRIRLKCACTSKTTENIAQKLNKLARRLYYK